MNAPVTIRFQAGTLLLEAPQEASFPFLERCVWDSRVSCWRAPAIAYADIVLALYREHIPYDDQARAYETLSLQSHDSRTPRPYQQEALQTWLAAQRRGVVVLPTGTGKTVVAHLAMMACQRSTLVVVPTIDLMTQWTSQLEKTFCCPVGMLGGGSHDVLPLTVSTYDSALLQMEFIGNRFGLLVVDECHHLPSGMYQQLARAAIAPYRLGLSATPERNDGEDTALDELLGPICYRKDITDMEDGYLAPYSTILLPVQLPQDDWNEYQRQRAIYVQFVRQHRINLSSPQGWGQFLRACTRMPGGREAFTAYLAQKRIALGNQSKVQKVWELLLKHRGERILIFTADNHTAYLIGERFLLPVITHHTKAIERKEMLECFRAGEYPVLVTSKVLNEGVDVPEASVAIVVSGSGSTREHVQRLGRILRPSPGKSAILYEIITANTSESYTSDRRRQNSAYERFD
ncbi:MAG: DEAD/DEAH box helicase family protein [Victivallales bacterium]|nr:DEAD/DEAH box helicase family protein [Victivallales bacterium]